ncbi:SPOR domain-containing protein [Flavobacterium kingsejongi]|uniref:Sporulation protein n=1 Tax=Flavobacterium kingsejongi TaxID=1678728 RepID=A0A2S1LLI0_9FLAO|nr:SPOR domain-containing protein [Flavobacterium kingsejongi]AWG24605.1 sporulation protein [Flavobacterium kingsejongi]
MKTEHYISQLLYRYQCVTVPGFGAFLTEIQSASLSESTNAFYPPKKTLSFNIYLKNNDGLLASHISQIEKIAYEDAVIRIQNEVASWKKILEKKETLILKHIGEIVLNFENNLIFTASKETNYLTDSFGLGSFISPSIKREVYKEQIQLLEEKAPIAFTPERRATQSYLKYAAVFVLTLLAAGFGGLKLRQNQINTQTLLVEQAVQEQVQDKIQEATFFIETPMPAVKLTLKEDKLPYHIVAGAFRDESNAQKKYEQLSRKGYKSRKLEKNKFGLYPVLYGSYSTYEEAQKNLNQIHSHVNDEAWLLIKEL